MSLVRKLISGSEERRSRLHTRRGHMVPVAEIGRLPALLVQRMRANYSTPWMARGAVQRLDRLLQPDMQLLELGSGASTAWYADRVSAVVSLEPDLGWAEHTRRATTSRNVNVLTGPIAELAPPLLAEDHFDVVVVDHSDEPDFSRVDALGILGSRVQIAVLDDSDRHHYVEAGRLMRDWTVERHVSFRSQPLVPTETTLYLHRQSANGNCDGLHQARTT